MTAGRRAELWRALGAVSETPGPAPELTAALELGELDAVAQTELFVLELTPYASRYLSPDGMLGGDSADRAAGIWRVLREPAPNEPDHLASLAGLYASLLEWEQGVDQGRSRESLRSVRRTVLWEHLASWLPAYLLKVAEIGDRPQRRWAHLWIALLEQEALELGPAPRCPVAWSTAPVAGGSGNSRMDLARSLAAPLDSGVLLSRGDLLTVAERAGLGSRMGERRFILQTLFEQDGPAAARELAGMCRKWRVRLRGLPPALGEAGQFWSGRAAVSARRLSALGAVVGRSEGALSAPDP